VDGTSKRWNQVSPSQFEWEAAHRRFSAPCFPIKSWAGKVNGDQGTWVQQRPDGSRRSFTNQAAVNSRKVKQLASLIKRNWPHNAKVGPPFIQSLVWFSLAELR